MYSETAVRMSSNQMTDEVLDQRCTLLSHLSYTPEKSSGGGGARTHNPRVKNHVLQSAVGHVLLATKVLVRGISVRESNPPTARQSPDSLDRAHVLQPAVAVCIQRPNEVFAEITALIGRVGFRQWAHARPSSRDAASVHAPWIAPGSLP